MDAISYTSARAHLAKIMDRVCANHEPLIITRGGEPSVVMISLSDYNALAEMAYLLHSPRNAKRLLEAITDLEGGGGQERKPVE
jgi:antitoxin YefM